MPDSVYGSRKSVPSHPHNCVDCGAGVHEKTVLHGLQYMQDEIAVALCGECHTPKKRCYACGVGEQNLPHRPYYFEEDDDFQPVWRYICTDCLACVREGKCNTVADEFALDYFGYDYSLCKRDSIFDDIPCCGGHKTCNECRDECCEHESHSPWRQTGLCVTCNEKRLAKEHTAEKIRQQDLDEEFADMWAEATVDYENNRCSRWNHSTHVF